MLSEPQHLLTGLFLWIPKTAGTSLYEWLAREINMTLVLSAHELARLDRARVQHLTMGHTSPTSAVEAGVVPHTYLAHAWVYAFARNPFDRAASLYRYHLMMGVTPAGWTFEQYLERVSEGVPPVGLYNARGLSQANPQVAWLRQPALPNVHFIGRVEDYAEGVDLVRERWGLQTLPGHANRSSGSSNSEVYATERAIELVREIYRDDFAFLGYQEQLPEQIAARLAPATSSAAPRAHLRH